MVADGFGLGRFRIEILSLQPGGFDMMYMSMAIIGKQMTEKHSIAEARRNLPKLIREAERGKTVELTRYGNSVAVLVGRQAFERLAVGRRRFSDAYKDFRRTVDLAELDVDPDELFANARDKTPGREFRF